MIKEIKEAFEIIQEKGLIRCSLTVYRKDIDEDDAIFTDCGDGLIEEILVYYIELIEAVEED